MNTINLTILLQVAGLLHLGLLCAGVLMPRAVGLRTHLATLPAFIRRLFWVYYTFIGFYLVSFGLITFTFAGTLAAGGATISASRQMAFNRISPGVGRDGPGGVFARQAK